ncbi:hypothetical protein BD410DRAFT_803209 [Rickenella mellea]|uniref:Uncharacterized protein n=1 Tax=Rickenella mellea TaxID=50990 RepID=A0A4Y7Q5E3_9AGAM|nr:hypothetical protein BD410DRAFT_803209 [Rickenella mellea]
MTRIMYFEDQLLEMFPLLFPLSPASLNEDNPELSEPSEESEHLQDFEEAIDPWSVWNGMVVRRWTAIVVILLSIRELSARLGSADARLRRTATCFFMFRVRGFQRQRFRSFRAVAWTAIRHREASIYVRELFQTPFNTENTASTPTAHLELSQPI